MKFFDSDLFPFVCSSKIEDFWIWFTIHITKLTNEIEPSHKAKHLIHFICKTTFQCKSLSKTEIWTVWMNTRTGTVVRRKKAFRAILYDQKRQIALIFIITLSYPECKRKWCTKFLCVQNPFIIFLMVLPTKSTANEVWYAFKNTLAQSSIWCIRQTNRNVFQLLALLS